MDDQSRAGNPSNQRVGYCNPPENTRFKKGNSGNPRGRPKGTLNLATVLERTLREKVIVNENGRRKTITKLEASVKQLTNKAATGDFRAMQLLAALVRSAEERASQVTDPDFGLDEDDQKVMEGILSRYGASTNNTQGGENENHSK